MRRPLYLTLAFAILALFSLSKCSEQKPPKPAVEVKATEPEKPNYGGYESIEKWGEHLVTVGGCNGCHTPKKFGPKGMVPNDSLKLSGHISSLPMPKIDRKMLQQNGLFASNDMTIYIGPWGVSYAANLTPDSTGIGSWKEEQFIMAIRQGVTKGLPGSRPMLPPMPWPEISQMTDPELKAVFAYLKSIPPIKNNVPAPLPPAK